MQQSGRSWSKDPAPDSAGDTHSRPETPAWYQSYKTFYSYNLQMLVVTTSSNKAFPA